MPHLLAIKRKPGRVPARFPFTVPVIESLEALDLDAPVTFFVGENGSGKSTLLEAIGAAAGLPAVGSQDPSRDPTLAAQAELGRTLTLQWRKRTHRGFFLRAEDFFGYQRRLARERLELKERLVEIDHDYQDRSAHARGLARGPVAGSLAEMERRYGRDPDARSHGEAFLQLFRGRFVPGSLILLDEPEAALSPQNQLGLVALLLAMIEQRAQFIVATHSPIVLGTPDARIYSFDAGRITRATYETLDHVLITRDFLNDRDRYLRRLAGG